MPPCAYARMNAIEAQLHVVVQNDIDVRHVTTTVVKEALQKTHLNYDNNGEQYYTHISALHKSIRGSDDNAAVYWVTRMMVAGEVWLAPTLVLLQSS